MSSVYLKFPIKPGPNDLDQKAALVLVRPGKTQPTLGFSCIFMCPQHCEIDSLGRVEQAKLKDCRIWPKPTNVVASVTPPSPI